MSLVRALVPREPDVTVDPKHGSADRTGIRRDMRADPPKTRTEVRDEAQHRIARGALVAILVLAEPLTAIVTSKVGQEFEQGGREVRVGRHGLCFDQDPSAPCYGAARSAATAPLSACSACGSIAKPAVGVPAD